MFVVSLINCHDIVLSTCSQFFSNIQSFDFSDNKKSEDTAEFRIEIRGVFTLFCVL